MVAIEYKWMNISLSYGWLSFPGTTSLLFSSLSSLLLYFLYLLYLLPPITFSPLPPPLFISLAPFTSSGACMGDTLRGCCHIERHVSPLGGSRMPACLHAFHMPGCPQSGRLGCLVGPCLADHPAGQTVGPQVACARCRLVAYLFSRAEPPGEAVSLFPPAGLR